MLRRIVTGNGAAVLAELAGEWWLPADAAALATIEQPALLVAAADSPRWACPTRAAGLRPDLSERVVASGGGVRRGR